MVSFGNEWPKGRFQNIVRFLGSGLFGEQLEKKGTKICNLYLRGEAG